MSKTPAVQAVWRVPKYFDEEVLFILQNCQIDQLYCLSSSLIPNVSCGGVTVAGSRKYSPVDRLCHDIWRGFIYLGNQNVQFSTSHVFPRMFLQVHVSCLDEKHHCDRPQPQSSRGDDPLYHRDSNLGRPEWQLCIWVSLNCISNNMWMQVLLKKTLYRFALVP